MIYIRKLTRFSKNETYCSHYIGLHVGVGIKSDHMYELYNTCRKRVFGLKSIPEKGSNFDRHIHNAWFFIWEESLHSWERGWGRWGYHQNYGTFELQMFKALRENESFGASHGDLKIHGTLVLFFLSSFLCIVVYTKFSRCEKFLYCIKSPIPVWELQI